ncbi:flagellar biosynthesis protein FlhF [Virgibacillus natechei]|uniref:Flagellar biosynthesis protein FlhF n=1 Tax=Virgibacillus natechei TaxID=1216297 RepID=A0ABS4IB18_9BACI|nr:flagellar biosynthesis protein FlhF [Virgibacillus natechei]MBP1968083.1 flagellar biosynthesis protein FlhF [Virgibacillus natechei]UZD14636.1 flagellar biosynthesis protein FlhF [Virgibacillus natechei]
MKVKKFVAPTMPEAMKQIRNELGSEAVILNSKEIKKGGFLGLFKKQNIEVIAALDPHPLETKEEAKTKKESKVPVINDPVLQSNSQSDSKEVINEIQNLKKIISHQALSNGSNYSVDYQLVYQHLLEQEVDNKLAEQLINNVVKKSEGLETKPSLNTIKQEIKKEIQNRLRDLSFEGITYDQKIVQFVGPTGVGKTTTLAKIAAHSMLNDNKKVAFITTDTYRIAAIEQLKTYARILDVPVKVAYTIEEYKNAIESFQNYDLILIDTAGRNFRDERYVTELEDTIDLSMDLATYLVLSLTAKPKDLTEIYDQFYHIPIKEVIFTKIDETRQYGTMLNIAINKHVGIAYVTNGQDVPDDLVHLTPEVITDYIVGENNA